MKFALIGDVPAKASVIGVTDGENIQASIEGSRQVITQLIASVITSYAEGIHKELLEEVEESEYEYEAKAAVLACFVAEIMKATKKMYMEGGAE